MIKTDGFRVGARYKTRNGDVAKVENVGKFGGIMECSINEGTVFSSYGMDGNCLGNPSWDLMSLLDPSENETTYRIGKGS